jgi:predicted ATPase/DNA-binding winged helix-turn-helix (wHTH) protein
MNREMLRTVPVDDDTFVFGRFRLVPSQRALLEDGKPLRLGSRALEILTILVEHAGETVRNDQLIARTWPETAVEENALRVHIAALRKALGEGREGKRYIVNIPGRGYCFIAPVTRDPKEPEAGPANGKPAANNLPAPLSRIIGRDQIIAALTAQITRRRLLTIVGPGGIGKTTVAIAAAQALAASYADGAWFVGLAPLADPELVPSTVAAALGVPPSGTNRQAGLTAWLRDKRALIVLDSCEHVVDAAATLAEAVLRAAPLVHVLATSREPLRAESEWLHRLAALETPPAGIALTAAEAMHYSAVQLFEDRARATVDGFTFSDADTPAVLEICRRLDGVPLALELAAARVGSFGLRDLAAHLEDRFRILTSGRRTALPRHQTLAATLDWSYHLLDEAERKLLRRLAAFAGEFSLDAALAVAGDVPAPLVVDHIANLAAKSLLVAERREKTVQYRLLDTTRLYAFEKLRGAGELAEVARRHAEHYCGVFAHADADSEALSPTEWLVTYGRHIDNMRAALDWAFSPDGDRQIGVRLTIAAVPLWVQLSQMNECRERVEQALSIFSPGANRCTPQEMHLYAALGASLMHTKGSVTETGVAWANTLEISEKLGDTKCQLQALRGLWAYRMENGEFSAALTCARRFYSLAENHTGPADLLVGEGMIGNSLHYIGDQTNARYHIERALRGYITSAPRLPINRYQFDQRVTARATLARILWLQGFPDQAMHAALTSVEEGHASEHVLSLCNALVRAACPVALWVGDLATAERCIGLLLDYSEQHVPVLWRLRGLGFKGILMNKAGETAAGLLLLGATLEQLRRTPKYAGPHYAALLGTFAEALAGAGRGAEGLVAINEALDISARTEVRVSVPELLCVKGELLLSEGGSSAAAAAEHHFRQALQLARQQNSLSWELRAATSLARLWRDQQQVAEGRKLLRSVYERFSEGFGTADLQAAKNLLEQLS